MFYRFIEGTGGLKFDRWLHLTLDGFEGRLEMNWTIGKKKCLALKMKYFTLPNHTR